MKKTHVLHAISIIAAATITISSAFSAPLAQETASCSASIITIDNQTSADIINPALTGIPNHYCLLFPLVAAKKEDQRILPKGQKTNTVGKPEAALGCTLLNKMIWGNGNFCSLNIKTDPQFTLTYDPKKQAKATIQIQGQSGAYTCHVECSD